MQWPSVANGPTITIAARCARVASARAAPHPENQPAEWWRARAFVMQKLAACWRPQQTRRRTVLHRLGGLSLVQWPFLARKSTTTIAARRGCVASARAAPQFLCKEIASVVARTRVCHAKACLCETLHLAHRTTALHRMEETFHWCIELW